MIEKEQYYTDKFLVLKLIGLVNERYKLDDFNKIIEPFAGDGSFSNFFYYNKDYKAKLLAIDIDPKKEGYIYQYDSFKYDFEYIYNDYKLIITNPPYSKSFEVLRKINSFTKADDVIAIILPSSYKNRHHFNTIPRKWHLIYQEDIPNNSFYNGNKTYDYNSVFMIFEKQDYNRPDEYMKEVSKYFQFVKDYNNADLAIIRVGFKASKININHYPNKNTNYYLKLKENIDKIDFIKAYNNIDFNDVINNSVVVKTLPKYKLIEMTNNYIKF